MNVALPPEQWQWLKSEVEAGRFGSIDEAIAVAVADLKVISESNLDWAKPLVEEARASVRQGKVISADEFTLRMTRKLEALRSS